MDMRKRLLMVLPIMVVMALGLAWLRMDKPHRDIGSEEARFRVVPEQLRTAFVQGSAEATGYLNAVVELHGVVVEDDGRRVVLEDGVVASWDTTRSRLLLDHGEEVHLKGRVTGYDDLFDEVRMDGLVLVE